MESMFCWKWSQTSEDGYEETVIKCTSNIAKDVGKITKIWIHATIQWKPVKELLIAPMLSRAYMTYSVDTDRCIRTYVVKQSSDIRHNTRKCK